MSVLQRRELEASPLADLHALASELSVDGFRRLRRAELITAILRHQGSEEESDSVPVSTEQAADDPASEPGSEDPAPRPRARSRARRPARGDDEAGPAEAPASRRAAAPKPRSARAPAASTRQADPEREERAATEAAPERLAEGVVDLLDNGSGFLRVHPPEPSDDDVYVSAAQVRRCELVSGDRVAGPVRRPRRTERYPSLVRVDTINGASADEVAEGTHYEDLPAGFPTERFAFHSEDVTLKAIEWLTPLGRGSRATIVGAPRAGKTEALRRLAEALGGQSELSVSVVLAGARPEEIAEWRSGSVTLTAAQSFAASPDALGQAVERAVDTAKRVAARGEHAVVLIDGLDGLPPAMARRALAAARNILDGGSLTVIAVAGVPVGGETTVIALDVAQTSTGRLPALDLVSSGTLRAELLVGSAGAEAIAQARAAALEAVAATDQRR